MFVLLFQAWMVLVAVVTALLVMLMIVVGILEKEWMMAGCGLFVVITCALGSLAIWEMSL